MYNYNDNNNNNNKNLQIGSQYAPILLYAAGQPKSMVQ